ncbi:TetR/AcrR family transcriptional regulator [Nocardioides albertanoniae]|nr:TetR/AcrR family transcriptional regulator [Nocardioides albertanoniae]
MVFNRYSFYAQEAGVAMGRTLGRNGLRAPTLKMVADEANMGISTLHQRFGGKRNMVPLAAAGYSGIFWTRVARRVNAHGWGGFLPTDADDVFFLRAWLSVEELARFDDELGDAVRQVWRDLRLWLGSSIGRELTDYESGGLVIVLRGLWDSLCSADPIDADLAQQLWSAAYDALTDDRAGEASAGDDLLGDLAA